MSIDICAVRTIIREISTGDSVGNAIGREIIVKIQSREVFYPAKIIGMAFIEALRLKKMLVAKKAITFPFRTELPAKEGAEIQRSGISRKNSGTVFLRANRSESFEKENVFSLCQI